MVMSMVLACLSKQAPRWLHKTMNKQAKATNKQANTMNKQAQTMHKPMNKQAKTMKKHANTIDKHLNKHAPRWLHKLPSRWTSPRGRKFLKDPPPAKQGPRWLNKHPVGYTSFPVGGQAPGVLSF